MTDSSRIHRDPVGGILISIQGLGLHSQTQKNLYKEGVEQHGLNKVFQGDYRELTEALQQEIQARKESVAAHAEEIAAFDMKINYLRVRTEDLRQKNGVEADLKDIIRQHIRLVDQLTNGNAVSFSSTPSSAKKQRK